MTGSMPLLRASVDKADVLDQGEEPVIAAAPEVDDLGRAVGDQQPVDHPGIWP